MFVATLMSVVGGTIAANVNSNWAPHGPRHRSRPSRKIRFKCANSISTRFLSRDDCLNASVLASARHQAPMTADDSAQKPLVRKTV